MRAFVAAVNGIMDEQDTLEDETSTAVFHDFGESSLNVLVVCFSMNNEWGTMMAARERLNLSIMDAVSELGLEIAFPTRTVHVVGESAVEVPPQNAGDQTGQST